MANKKKKPGEKKLPLLFVLKEKYHPLIKQAADQLDVSKSEFIENAIVRVLVDMFGEEIK